ncbi:MAG: phospho-N-acetylmuramoyl-pentapeptide-transferase [Eubacteriales bacterium]
MKTQVLAILVGFAVSLASGYAIIPLLKRLKAGQHVRDDGPQTHLQKEGTPTMGGIMTLIGVIVATLIFAKDSYEMVLVALGAYLAYTVIGLIDDLIIVTKKRSMGLRASQKFSAQVLVALLVALYAYFNADVGSKVIVPFFNIEWDMGVWYIPFTMFMMVAMVNSVNLMDGVDGLAGSVTMINAGTFIFVFSSVLGITFVSGTIGLSDMQNMAVFAAALAGALLAFLHFNAYPAKVFMGDTGSLGLGAALSVMGIFSRLSLILPIIGLMYVLTALSVMIQVGHYKRTKKRVFRMAPLHHHFELGGVKEPKIVASYCIITAVLCLLTLLGLS